MRIEKHLIGQKVIVRYMEDTDSDILGLAVINHIDGHVFRDVGIILHPSGVFSNVLMQVRHGIRKTSDLSKSDCSLHEYADNGILTMKAI